MESATVGFQALFCSSFSIGGADAAVEVVDVVLAQLDGVGVGDVLAGGGGAPRVVLAAAQLDVHADAGERDAAGADAGALELLEHQQLRGEVAGLRAEDGDRVAARGVRAGDHQRVGHAAPAARSSMARLSAAVGERAAGGGLRAPRCRSGRRRAARRTTEPASGSACPAGSRACWRTGSSCRRGR